MLVMGLGTATVTELAAAAVMDRTTLTRNLRPLQDQKLISLRQGQDRRVKEVTLTRRGEVALARGLPLWKKLQAEVAASLGEDRLKRLLTDLSASVARLRTD